MFPWNVFSRRNIPPCIARLTTSLHVQPDQNNKDEFDRNDKYARWVHDLYFAARLDIWYVHFFTVTNLSTIFQRPTSASVSSLYQCSNCVPNEVWGSFCILSRNLYGWGLGSGGSDDILWRSRGSDQEVGGQTSVSPAIMVSTVVSI